MVLCTVTGLVVLAICAALIPVRSSLVEDVPLEFLGLALVAVPFTLVNSDAVSVLRGLQRFGAANALLVIGTLLALVLLAILLVA